MNNLTSYSDTFHPLYFLTRYIEGLRPELRAAVMVHRPHDLDAACALAALQEESTEDMPHERSRYKDYHLSRPPSRASFAYAIPLVAAYRQPAIMPAVEEKKSADIPHTSPESSRAHVDTSKVAALRNYRRARGLCFKCGRWGKDHVCPSTICSCTSWRSGWIYLEWNQISMKKNSVIPSRHKLNMKHLWLSRWLQLLIKIARV